MRETYNITTIKEALEAAKEDYLAALRMPDFWTTAGGRDAQDRLDKVNAALSLLESGEEMYGVQDCTSKEISNISYSERVAKTKAEAFTTPLPEHGYGPSRYFRAIPVLVIPLTGEET